MNKHSEKTYFEDWHIRMIDSVGDKIISCTIRLNRMSGNVAGILQGDYTSGENRVVFSEAIQDVQIGKDEIHFGENRMSSEAIHLAIKNAKIAISGQIGISQSVNLRQSFIKPGFMGFYKYIPGLEFYQEIPVLKGDIDSIMYINGKEVDFSGGSIYIHKQWGKKFPNVWLSAQCGGFKKSQDMMISIGMARLKILFNYYTAFAIPVYYNDQLEVFSNYNGGHIAKFYRYKGYVHLVVTQKSKLLDIKIYGRDEIEYTSSKETHGIRDVYECDKVKMEAKLMEHGSTLWEGSSSLCHIEIGGNTSKLK